jgi:hypothetical protein
MVVPMVSAMLPPYLLGFLPGNLCDLHIPTFMTVSWWRRYDGSIEDPDGDGPVEDSKQDDIEDVR